MIHTDNSVSLSYRTILKLYHILQERILLPSEIQVLSSTFQSLLQTRIGTPNEIIFTNVTINAQSYIFGEALPQVDVVVTIYARYVPPPEVHFSKLLMEEFGNKNNMEVYRDELNARGSDYFGRLHAVGVGEYVVKRVKNEFFETDTEEKKSYDNINHYQYNTQPEEDKQPSRGIQDVSAKTYYGTDTSSENYGTVYNVDDGSIISMFEDYSIDRMQNTIAFISVLSFVGIILFGIIYTQRRKRQKRNTPTPEKHVTFSNVKRNPKKVLLSTSIANKKKKEVSFTGVTDVELKEKKNISFRGVMDYENDSHNSEKETKEQHQKEHESYVLNLL